jgi:hypothetical protein
MSSNSKPVPPPPPTPAATPPGVKLPTVQPLNVGTSSPAQSAYQSGVNSSAKQNNMINSLSGGKKRYLNGGTTSSSSSYSVPQFNMQYTPQNGPGQNPNDVIKSSVGTSGQTHANSVYDSCIGKTNCSGQTGGTKVCNSGEVDCWGCYSGGKKKRKTHNKRKTNKKRKTYKKRKTQKKRKYNKK